MFLYLSKMEIRAGYVAIRSYTLFITIDDIVRLLLASINKYLKIGKMFPMEYVVTPLI